MHSWCRIQLNNSLKEAHAVGLAADKHPYADLEDNFKKAMSELLLLFLLSEKDCYIGELTAALSRRSGNILSMVFPYAAVYRLEQGGYIVEIGKRIAPDGRRRQYLRITDAGRIYLRQLLEAYSRLSQSVANILEGEKKDDQ